ncbi:MAG: alginate lyase family protein, partial [Betaproteobacteria bacterium]|nr:alginate lyase family protein [Betaproteobacteria bacterium]
MDASQPGNLAPPLRPGLKERLRRRLGWKLNRLRCMTPAEVAYRVARAAQARFEKAGWIGAGAVPAPDLSRQGKKWIHGNENIDPLPYVAAANRIVEGWMDVFALRNLDFGAPPRWNRDPKTGIEAPLAFGKLLDYRDPDLVGDIKYLWEPNRHLHLVTLAQAHALTGQRKYFDVIAEHLETWILACPYPYGPNWSSALEPALRLINWAIAWQLTGGVLNEEQHGELRERWLRSIYQHCRFVRGWFSLHSSANNHLIGEAAALYVASVTWPHWGESRAWREAAKSILEREALAQNAPDGVNREQAVSYQQFVFDFLLIAMLAGRANGEAFPPAYEARLEAMLDFVASIMDAGGNVPMFGDADDALVVRFDPAAAPSDAYRSMLATGAVLFGRGDFKRKGGRLDDKARWLLGAGVDERFGALDAEKTALPTRQQFPEGGYYILGCELDTPGEIRVVADAGPLGYRSIAAHGHADALSFTLSVAGREFLVDPGTYAYHTQARWRSYFRGTGAHNTVRIDGVDQSEPGGAFMWLRKARAGCSLWLSSAQKDSFEGWHDGYMRLPDPVKHRRLIELDKRERRIVVEDTLEMAEEHEVELLFHCSERCAVERAEG